MLASTEIPASNPVENVLPSTVVLRSMDGVDFAVPSSHLKSVYAVTSALRSTPVTTTPADAADVSDNKEDAALASINDNGTLQIISTKNKIPTLQVPHVSSLILNKVLNFLNCHVDLLEQDFNEKNFKVLDSDFEFFDEMKNEELLQIAFAANVLDIPLLLHTVGEVIAKKINEQEDDEAIKKLFNLDALPLVNESANGDDNMQAEEVGDENEEEWEDIMDADEEAVQEDDEQVEK